jgi:hypothetical protein
MRIDIARIAAARESAAPVARAQGALQGGWDAPCFAADAKGFAVLVLDDGNNARVARESARSFCRDVRAVLDLASARASRLQRFHVDVHDDLMFVTAAHGSSAVLQEALGQQF